MAGRSREPQPSVRIDFGFARRIDLTPGSLRSSRDHYSREVHSNGALEPSLVRHIPTSPQSTGVFVSRYAVTQNTRTCRGLPMYYPIRHCLLKLSLSVMILAGAITNTVHAQTVTVKSGSISLGAGLGTLTYTETDRSGSCDGAPGPLRRGDSYQSWTYSNFVLNDSSGSHRLTGGVVFFESTGPSPPCEMSSRRSAVTLTGEGYNVSFVPGPGVASATLLPTPGFINPKYLILSVVYAPPGSQSTVQYGTSTLVGSSTSISDSITSAFAQSFSIGVDIGTGIGPASAQSTVTGTVSSSYTEERDSSESISVSKTTTDEDLVRGPSSSLGVDHDYDVIWLWLNPTLKFAAGPGPNDLQWTGYGYDPDDVNEMDKYPVIVGWLNGHIPMPPDVATVLARSWASNQIWPAGQGPGLNAADFATILAADPFSDPAYTVTVPAGSHTSTDGRFTMTANSNVVYQPAPIGGGPITQSYTDSYSSTDAQGQGSKSTSQVGFSLEESFKAGFFAAHISADFKQSFTLTMTDQWSQTRTNTAGQSASLSVTGPAATDNYTGPTEFVVYQDNIYGTFMFYPLR
jgi:hypothetical protein